MEKINGEVKEISRNPFLNQVVIFKFNGDATLALQAIVAIPS